MDSGVVGKSSGSNFQGSGITKNPSGAVLPRDLVLKGAASYSPALHCSTIGAIGLNFSVRNGKRWNTDAIATQRGLTLLTGKM